MSFETIYRWFTGWFGGDMADYLSGYKCPTDETDGGYIAANQFTMYGFIALGIALAMIGIYYYLIDHPRFNRLWNWLLVLVLVGISNLLIGALMTKGDLNAGNIDDCLINGSNGGIFNSTTWMFGLANFVVSILFFFILSLAFKWGSRNCKHSHLFDYLVNLFTKN